MGLYRTKPEEVEAIQYTGSMSEPFDGVVPAWIWAHISTGSLTFTAHGIQISYSGLTELVAPDDWLVLHNDGIIRACEDKVFKQYYSPARKRLMGAGASEDKTATAAVGGVGVATVEVEAA